MHAEFMAVARRGHSVAKPLPSTLRDSSRVVFRLQPDSVLPGSILHLQRQVGNSAVGVLVARQSVSLAQPTVPVELRNSVNLRTLSEERLQHRYDLITDTLARFRSAYPNTTTVEMGELEGEAGRIGSELLRRDALAKGRTFGEAEVTAMRDYFTSNARKPTPDSCIVCMNTGFKLLLSDPGQKTTPESIEKTMELFEANRRAGAAREIYFLARNGSQTRGSRRPEKLPVRVFDTVLSLAGHDVGWSVFALSLMDGYHSVTLTLDNNDPSRPRVFWSDQWSSKGGWKEYDADALDKEIVSLVQSWWDPQPARAKHTTVIRLWRLSK